MKALVTGGHFEGEGVGVLWEIDFAAERSEVALRWAPPQHLHVSGKGFAGGSRDADGTLYVAAHAAVVRIDPVSAEVTGVLHQPCMNDLHHVAVQEGRLYVSNTGLDAVEVFGIDGSFVGSHGALPAWVHARRFLGEDPPNWQEALDAGWAGAPRDPWTQSSQDDGYHSTNRATAPFHRLKIRDHLHINHVAFDGDQMLATCFADGTIRDLEHFRVLYRAPGAYLHDGVVLPQTVWISAIDGTLLELDRSTLREMRRIGVFDSGHHGWCRGLAVTDEFVLVGLTEVRRSRLPRHRWAEREPEGSETSVLLLNHANGRLLARVNLTDESRHSKIYSLLPISEVAG